MFKKYLVIFFLASSCLLVGQLACARDSQDITDWYIQDFKTDIVANKDSSLFITENITADCGNLPDKHGIFRVLPTQVKTDEGVVFKNPIELVSIADFDGNPLNYETIKDSFDHTITWKIGDAGITVSGLNYYRIIYRVQNAIRFGNNNFDELYWNLLGNFWDIETDNFSAKIFFPSEINSQNTQVDYYTGELGSKDKSLATYFWDNNNVLNFNSVSDFNPREGVTVSVTFPKNIFTPYVPTFGEQYGEYFWCLSFLIPLGIFIFAFSKWRKYGKDPKMKKPIPPEFGIPDNITPIQMGMILSHGKWRNNFMTAAIIDLAVRKFILIEQKEEKVLFFKAKEIILKKNAENYDLSKVTPAEKKILTALFKNYGSITLGELPKVLARGIFADDSEQVGAPLSSSKQYKDSVELSSLKKNFCRELPDIKKSAARDAINNGWITDKGNKYAAGFVVGGIIAVWISFVTIAAASLQLFLSILISGIILILFAIFMPKRTQKGVDLLFKIRGFELYMKQAENYRQQFYEKENIFDKFLPYAIVFGIAELWAKKMQLIYGEDYFKNYHPVWFVGVTSANFDLNSFTSQLNSITSSISSSTSSHSGAGGSGGAGGGGGGGGGGGW